LLEQGFGRQTVTDAPLITLVQNKVLISLNSLD
jgi:hypothetical protein